MGASSSRRRAPKGEFVQVKAEKEGSKRTETSTEDMLVEAMLSLTRSKSKLMEDGRRKSCGLWDKSKACNRESLPI